MITLDDNTVLELVRWAKRGKMVTASPQRLAIIETELALARFWLENTDEDSAENDEGPVYSQARAELRRELDELRARNAD